MKGILLILLVSFSITPVFSQVALLDRIYDMIQSGDLKKAEEAVLIAEGNALTKNDPRTYYLKSFIYKELYIKDTTHQKYIFRDMAFSNLNHCIQLDKDKALKSQTDQLLTFLNASIFNDGTGKFNARKYRESIKLLGEFIKRTSNKDEYWMDANYFRGMAYYNLNIADSAITILEYLKSNKYNEPLLYLDLSTLYANSVNKEKALPTLAEGLARYPQHVELQMAEFNVLSSLAKYDELEIKLDSFLRKTPDNVDVLLMAGTVYEKKGKSASAKQIYFDKRENVYKKILQFQPRNYDANYNLGVLYYNQAVEIINAQELDIDIKELTKILERSSQLFQTALPFLLTIYNKDESNQPLLQAFQAIYYNLNMKPELAEINARLNKLKNG